MQCFVYFGLDRQDQDVELDSIPHGKTVQGIKDRFVGFPVPRIAATLISIQKSEKRQHTFLRRIPNFFT